MKRWGLQRISHLCLVATISARIATAGLAATPGNTVSSQPKEQTNTTDVVLLAQTDEILGLGSAGDAVKDLQAMLALMGYYSGAVDGAYEEMTLEAVRQFQTDAGLIVDGIVGPLTWQRLLPTPTSLGQTTNLSPSQELQASVDETESASAQADNSSGLEGEPGDEAISATAGNLSILKLDDSGAEVNRLQTRLAALGLYMGPIDGVFGLQTQQAVEQFQRQTGLTVDGIVGPATWLELFK